MMHPRGDGERGVSVAITHVLAIGITGILITFLIFGAGSMVDGQSEESISGSLTIVGERLASDMTTLEDLSDSASGDITLETNSPQNVAGISYRVVMHESSPACETDESLLTNSHDCLELTAGDTTVFVPIEGVELDDSASTGSDSIVLVHDGSEVSFQ
ncbi:MAG: hypothetical protein U5K37_06775 [Natrialbaceae archaeon]|nr:hypothetical protein [Natrialbaceae archaeon]